MGGRRPGQEFEASTLGDSFSLGRSWDSVKNGAQKELYVRDLEESIKEMETLVREMMAGGLIGLKDHGIDAGERTKDIGTVTLKSLMKKRGGHFMTALRRK